MAEAARVTGVVPDVEGLVGGRHGEMKSEQSIPRACLSQTSTNKLSSFSAGGQWVGSTDGGRQASAMYLPRYLGGWLPAQSCGPSAGLWGRCAPTA